MSSDDPVQKALRAVKQLCPDTCCVVFTRDKRWHYCDEDLQHVEFADINTASRRCTLETLLEEALDNTAFNLPAIVYINDEGDKNGEHD